jgi:hypothetical protein
VTYRRRARYAPTVRGCREIGEQGSSSAERATVQPSGDIVIMLRVRVLDDAIRIGRHFAVSFQRTLRIPDDGGVYPLPPGLGRFPLGADAGEGDVDDGAW